ncbi:hypothetical protein OB03_07290 [Brevundimonas sp. GN22]
MRNRVFKPAGLALTFAILATSGLAHAAPTTTAASLPDAPVATEQAQTAAPMSVEQAPAQIPDETATEVQQPDALEQPSKILPWATLGVALLALLAAIVLGINAFLTERNHNRMFDAYDEAFDASAKRIRDLEERINSLDRSVDSHRNSLKQFLEQMEGRTALRDRDIFAQRTQPAPAMAPQPSGASPEEVESLLVAYREILQARDPEPLNRFIEAYKPRNVSVSNESITLSQDGDGSVWLIARPHWGGEGLVLPGDYAIRNWATTFQPSGGLRAEKLFGSLYWVEKGNLLEIKSPCRIHVSEHGPIRIVQKGTLLGA